jgi:hypothetical protein
MTGESEMEIARVLADPGEDYLKMQLALDKLQRVAWIESMGPWELMMTGTYRWSASLDSARRTFVRWVQKNYGRVSYFMCVEEHGRGSGYHVHSLWADAQSVYRREAWNSWFGKYGRFLLEPVRSARDSSDYASKYLSKPNGWWDFRLQWHRRQQVNGASNYFLSR